MDPGYEFYCENQLRELLLFFVRRHSMVPAGERPCPAGLLNMINYCDRNFEKAIQFEDLVKIAGMSSTSLCRAFTREFGVSPMAYLQKLRINKSKLMLVDLSRSITEIAIDAGFTDSSYFSRVFKKRTACTQQEFRKQLILRSYDTR